MNINKHTHEEEEDDYDWYDAKPESPMPKLVSRPSNKMLRKSKSKTKTGTANYDSTETLKVMEAALQATNYEVNCEAIYKDVNAYTQFPEM